MKLPRPLDVASSMTASAMRLGRGYVASHAGPRPERPVELYEFEACPHCRRVREALTMLDLSVMIYPCPDGGPTYRQEVIERGGKAQFPYFVDPNTGEEFYESSAIIDHLYRHYGKREVPWWLGGFVNVMVGSLATLVRTMRGGYYRPARAPDQPLELFGFEISPYTRLVREVLCELELPYLLVNTGKHSANRPTLIERSGREPLMVPWLSDPNTGREMFESAEIVRYLEDTYAQ